MLPSLSDLREGRANVATAQSLHQNNILIALSRRQAVARAHYHLELKSSHNPLLRNLFVIDCEKMRVFIKYVVCGFRIRGYICAVGFIKGQHPLNFSECLHKVTNLCLRTTVSAVGKIHFQFQVYLANALHNNFTLVLMALLASKCR